MQKRCVHLPRVAVPQAFFPLRYQKSNPPMLPNPTPPRAPCREAVPAPTLNPWLCFEGLRPLQSPRLCPLYQSLASCGQALRAPHKPPEMCRLPPPPQTHPSLAGLRGDYTTLPADGITSTSCPLPPGSTAQLPAPTPTWQRNGAEQTPKWRREGCPRKPTSCQCCCSHLPPGLPRRCRVPAAHPGARSSQVQGLAGVAAGLRAPSAWRKEES